MGVTPSRVESDARESSALLGQTWNGDRAPPLPASFFAEKT